MKGYEVFLVDKELVQARKEIDESTSIFREACKANPKVYGDDLAASLYLTAKILMQQEPSKACEPVKEVSHAAASPNFKKMAEVRFPDCKASSE